MFKLKITRVEQKNIALDTIKLKNLQEMIQEQDEKLHIGEYYYKIYERKNETILMKVSFHYENVIIKSEKITKKEQKKSLLKSHFNLDRSIDTEKEPELINLGRSLATVVLLTNNELIEYSMSKRDLKELPTLVEQLEKKNCFMNDELLKLELNYRKAKKTDDIHLKNQTLEQVFLGNLTEYTIEDFFEDFENKGNEEILEIYTIPNSNNTGYQMVYEFKNKKLIYKEVFDSLKLPLLKKSLEEFNQINNLEAFKKKFSIMNM